MRIELEDLNVCELGMGMIKLYMAGKPRVVKSKKTIGIYLGADYIANLEKNILYKKCKLILEIEE